ncbi:TolC family protein [Altericroceibacterium spongiae]|uniref:TolC family protein n=1 Tax=Altericroceibacterium spongiae TaxID=2320269 RepID=A0A420EIW4_9SPHN|nr:TolC family protein [Altericroceibacterium spongiae]RKF20608.1 TolC family protein [Altericroceibacterium spongiae]
MRKGFLTIAALPLLAACATVPDYAPPAQPTLPDEQGGFVTQATDFDPSVPLPDRWWQLYDDPALDRLVQQALSANTDLRVADANLKRANAVLKEARAGRLPSTTLSGGATYGDSLPGANGQAGGGTFSDSQFSVLGSGNVSWEADLFGRIGNAIRAANADAQASKAARDAVRVTVAAETTRSYLNICTLGLAQTIAEESIKTSQDSLKLIRQRQEAGAAGRLEVERAAAAYARAQAQLPTIRAQRRVAQFELAALLGATPAEVPGIASQCTTPPDMSVSRLPIGDGEALLRRRPDLRAAERQLAADTARIGVATADLYPRISLGATGNFLRNDDVKGSDSFSFSLGPLISWSFPNMSVARARLRQAEAQGEASLASFDGQVLTALKEVEQALTTVENEGERLQSLREARDRSENAFKLANLRYRAGSVAYLDVLTAQQDLLEARASYASSIQTLSSDRVDLFKALGGGWQSMEETTDAQQ